MCVLRIRPRTDVDPPRVELPSVRGISSRRPRGDNLSMMPCKDNATVVFRMHAGDNCWHCYRLHYPRRPAQYHQHQTGNTDTQRPGADPGDRLVVNSHDSSTVVQVSSTSSTVDDDDEFWWPRDRLAMVKFLSTEFGTKLQRAVPLLSGMSKCLYNTVWDRWKEASVPKPARFVQSFRYNTSLWRTDGRTDGRKHDDGI